LVVSFIGEENHRTAASQRQTLVDIPFQPVFCLII